MGYLDDSEIVKLGKSLNTAIAENRSGVSISLSDESGTDLNPSTNTLMIGGRSQDIGEATDRCESNRGGHKSAYDHLD